ncbi:MAG: hypothetical protein IPK28_08065 [Devosia sp.]|nr:hypothetical protein [Devosia sp.]
MEKSISKLIELAKQVRVTEKQRRAQRRSFVYGNTAFENPDITRELVDEVDAEMTDGTGPHDAR